MSSQGVAVKRARRRRARVVGERIEDLRLERGWSQTELAAAMTREGFAATQALVSRAESGSVPDAAELIAFAVALDVTITYLLGLTDNRKGWKPDGDLKDLATRVKLPGNRSRPSVIPGGRDSGDQMAPVQSPLLVAKG